MMTVINLCTLLKVYVHIIQASFTKGMNQKRWIFQIIRSVFLFSHILQRKKILVVNFMESVYSKEAEINTRSETDSTLSIFFLQH
jgi:hypothetical protein